MDYVGVNVFITNHTQPFCLFVASSLPHGPNFTKIENGLYGYPANNWMSDWQLGKCMQMLKQAGNAYNTLVIFVSNPFIFIPNCSSETVNFSCRSVNIVKDLGLEY